MQRLTFDSMYRVLDLEPGWLHRGEGEERERERERAIESLDKDSANARAENKESQR